jgi:poly [ADP-ribose] polymerase 7/11/12/13
LRFSDERKCFIILSYCVEYIFSKKEKMKRKKKDGNITELQLFHGTNEEIVDAICRQGFDFRFSGSKTGHKYGKGSYFAKMWYSITYSGYT